MGKLKITICCCYQNSLKTNFPYISIKFHNATDELGKKSVNKTPAASKNLLNEKYINIKPILSLKSYLP